LTLTILLVEVSFKARRVCLTVIALTLVACGHTPVTRTLSDAFVGPSSISGLSLNPALRYLRVVANGREALLVLGYSEPSVNGTLDTWYSSQGEVLQLQDGRILSTIGLQRDWRAVHYLGLPNWSEVIAQHPLSFTRYIDVMPGYQFGVKEHLLIQAIPTPYDARLLNIAPSSLVWFEETQVSDEGTQPTARYGLKIVGSTYSVVYGEQCLSPTFCIAWQSWPVSP
jgi:hypothetical protein